MKIQKITIIAGAILFIGISSFVARRSGPVGKPQKSFATFTCYKQNMVANLDAGGTETLGYINIWLDAANNNANTVGTISNVDIESSSCVTYTITSISGDFIRACILGCTQTYWKARNVEIHYTGTNGSGVLYISTAAFIDGSLAC
jgi:hypothetical protein